MQFTILALTAFAGLAVATDLDTLAAQVPTCSQSCLLSAGSAAGCGETDYSCQCENREAITSNSTTCIMSSCSVSDISTTQTVVTEICEAVSNGTATSTASNATMTGSSSSSSASSTSTTGSSAGSQIQLAGLGWAAVLGAVGYLAL